MHWIRAAVVGLVMAFATSATAQAQDAVRERPRVIVLTDIENEPDDAQSLVRFLVYSNQWDVEGLIATTSIHLRERPAPWRIQEIVAAYGQVRDNLEVHEPGFPRARDLEALIMEGQPEYGLAAIGAGKDSDGSRRIIAAVDSDDPRPVWVLAWGGPNTLAQALWTVRQTRPPEAVARFVSRLRVYTISDQDDSGPWIREAFPDLFYIASPGMHAGGAYHAATWVGISGDRFHGRFVGADHAIVDNPWLDVHVRAHGPLGAQYPHTEFIMEGDTPSFLNLIDNGLSDPERPGIGGWGGRYEFYTPRTRAWFLQPETRPFWTDAEDEVLGADGRWHTGAKPTIWRWREAYQNDFAARMQWTVRSYDEANHPPIPRLGHPERLSARPGEVVRLSAEGSGDPDGDPLTYAWFVYNEAGTLVTSQGTTGAPIRIENADQAEARLVVPESRLFRLGEMHVILAVTDQGAPALTRYRRVVVDVRP
jgi:hypothetical protein